jgi:hypothetical protein
VRGLAYGSGVLMYANGDRFDGPFENDQAIFERGRYYFANGNAPIMYLCCHCLQSCPCLPNFTAALCDARLCYCYVKLC